MSRQVIVPAGLKVPLPDFAAVYNVVETRWLADTDNVYLAASLNCFHWVVGQEGVRTPMTNLARPFDVATMRAEMWSAADVVFERVPRRPGQPSDMWALAVMNTLAWLLGVRKVFPIRL